LAARAFANSQADDSLSDKSILDLIALVGAASSAFEIVRAGRALESKLTYGNGGKDLLVTLEHLR
jgi:hypothetical protein